MLKTRKRISLGFLAVAAVFLCYVAGYFHFVRPKPVRIDPSGPYVVEPVFRTARSGLIRLFRPAISIDQALLSWRWKLKRFQLGTTNLDGLKQMRPFEARVVGVGRTMPYNTDISALSMKLQLKNGKLLEIRQSDASEDVFARAGRLMDTRLHQFPQSWFEAGRDK